MKKPVALALSALAILQPVSAMAQSDVFSSMFAWWNTAFKTKEGFNAAAFRKYFTENATLTLEGHQAIRGIDNWVTHFRKIQASGAEVEIVVPFKTVFRQGDKIYTYHVIRSRRGGKASCTLAAGHAVVERGKIAAITLVRAPIDPAKGPLDPQCWTD
jgi:hypothetical protein